MRTGLTRRDVLKTTAVANASALAGSFGGPRVARAQRRRLVVWWTRGSYREEDEALLRIAQAFEQVQHVTVDLSFTLPDALRTRVLAALSTGRVPDVVFCLANDWEVVPTFGWEGKLADCTDLITALKPRYDETMLPAAYVWNHVEQQRAYYGVPMAAQTLHSHYWRDLVQAAGLSDAPDTIPRPWDAHWAFWKMVQDRLRKKNPAQDATVYGIGLTASPRAVTTLYTFDMARLAFGGELLSDDGAVIADQPKNREALIATLRWFGALVKTGSVPPDTVTWMDDDNRACFHARSVAMTLNPSLSIPLAELLQDPARYFVQSATIEWPDNPGGGTPTYRIAVKPIIVPHAARAPDLGKEFIRFILEPTRFGEYVRAARGRWFPAFTDLQRDPFFAHGMAGPGGPVDPHIPVAARIYRERRTAVFEHWKHPGYSRVCAEQVWGKALSRTIGDQWPADKAVDEAIGRMKTLFARWNPGTP